MNTFFLYSDEVSLKHLLPFLRVRHGKELPQQRNEYYSIIHWGSNPAEEVKALSSLQLQPNIQVNRTLNKETSTAVLLRSGVRMINDIKYYSAALIYRHRFQIPIFHLEALTVYKSNPNHVSNGLSTSSSPGIYEEIEMDKPDKFMRLAIKEAIRAVYSLGLGYGTVEVEIVKGEAVIVDVNPLPLLNERNGKLFAAAINQYDELLGRELIRDTPIWIGMDPEFILREPQGRLVFASKFLKKTGKVGYDGVRVRRDLMIYPLAELRPDPSREPKNLLLNLRKTMREAAGLIVDSSLEWLAGGMPQKGIPLGGHLHMSGIWLNIHLLHALDAYLALPLMLAEDQTTSGRRPRYGYLGDFRRKFHGGFEYRTLPSWIVSPLITRGVIALFKVIAEHHLQLLQRPLFEEKIQEAYYSGKKTDVIEVVGKLWTDLEALSTYRHYENYILPLKHQMMSFERWDEQQDFRQAWKIPPYS